MFTFTGMTHARGTVEFLMVLPALVAMLVAPTIRQASAAAETTGGHIRVLHETPVSPAADIPQNVRDECHALGKEMPNAIVRASRRVTLVQTPKELMEKNGKYLFVEITQVKAKGAGALTGPKHLIVRGSLIENGKEIANFEGDKGTLGAKGTCSTLDKAEKDLGADIGRWLEHPKPNDRLGQ
jgi:hypothetical protein